VKKQDDNNKKEKYSYEFILQQLSGNLYYSENTTKYIYHQVNGHKEEAAEYLKLTLAAANLLNKIKDHLHTQEEIDEINKNNKII
jgi:hypothetical protein